MRSKSKAYNNDKKTKGWPPARRKAQAERLKRARIWEKSTGPKTKAGKENSRENSYKHGFTTREAYDFMAILRLQRQYIGMINETLKRPYRDKHRLSHKNGEQNLNQHIVALEKAGMLLYSYH